MLRSWFRGIEKLGESQACSRVNGAIHSRSRAKLFIGCIYYGINFQLGYVAELEGDAVHFCLGGTRFWPGLWASGRVAAGLIVGEREGRGQGAGQGGRRGGV